MKFEQIPDFNFFELLNGRLANYNDSEVNTMAGTFSEEQRGYMWFNTDSFIIQFWDGENVQNITAPYFDLPQKTLFVSPNFVNAAPYFSTIQSAQNYINSNYSATAYQWKVHVYKGTYNEKLTIYADTHCESGVIIFNNTNQNAATEYLITNTSNSDFTGYATINTGEYLAGYYFSVANTSNVIHHLEFNRIRESETNPGHSIIIVGSYNSHHIFIKGKFVDGPFLNQSNSQIHINLDYLGLYKADYEGHYAEINAFDVYRIESTATYGMIKCNCNTMSVVSIQSGTVCVIDNANLGSYGGSSGVGVSIYGGGVVTLKNCNINVDNYTMACIYMEGEINSIATLKLKNTTLVTSGTYSIVGNDNTYCIVNASGGGNSSNKTYYNVDWNGLALQVNTEIEI